MERQKEKEELQKDLLFYLEHYNEISSRGGRIKKVLDKEIQDLVKTLKKLGK